MSGTKERAGLKREEGVNLFKCCNMWENLSIKSCQRRALTAESTLPWLSYEQEINNWRLWDGIAFLRSLAVEEKRFSGEWNCDSRVTFERSKSRRKMCCFSRLECSEGVCVPSGKKENGGLQTWGRWRWWPPAGEASRAGCVLSADRGTHLGCKQRNKKPHEDMTLLKFERKRMDGREYLPKCKYFWLKVAAAHSI